MKSLGGGGGGKLRISVQGYELNLWSSGFDAGVFCRWV